jgi:hypothetical protein
VLRRKEGRKEGAMVTGALVTGHNNLGHAYLVRFPRGKLFFPIRAALFCALLRQKKLLLCGKKGVGYAGCDTGNKYHETG